MRSYPCAALGAIAYNADFSPNAPALIEPDGKTFGYNELWQQIEAISRQLQGAGVGAGERVAVLLPQGALQILAVAGVLDHHIAIPLQAKTTAAEVETSLRRLSVSALIASPEFSVHAEAANEGGLIVFIARDGQSPQDWEVRAPPFPSKLAAVRSEAILLLITSATTDRSKVVPLTGANLDAGVQSRRHSLQLTVSDRLLSMTSQCHIIGVENALAQFVVGGAIIATGGFDPASFVSWLDDLRPTWYDCAPAVHQAALAQLKSNPPNRPVSLRFVQSAGAPLPSEVREELEQRLQIPVFNDYGMTEACPIAMDAFLLGGRVTKSAGRSCGMQIGIMNSSRELLPTGEEGEIAVRGPAVFSGYEDDAEANRNAFHDGWFRTGDLGRLDQEGNLFVTGRLKEMINRGGEKILPGEVDEALASHPAVLEAAAFPVPHPTLGEDVACAIVLREGDVGKVSAQELRRYAAERLAAFKVPHRIYFFNEIPRGELGKSQRWILAEQVSGRDAAMPTAAEVSEEVTVNGVALLVLHEIWSRILGREDLRFNEDFFEAGGDSLAALNMLAEVDQRYDGHTSASAAKFIDEPTLTNLCRLLGDAPEPSELKGDSSDMQIFPVSEADSGTRLFCFTPHAIEGLSYRRLAKYLRGEMGISIVRPANTLYTYSLFTFERMAAEATALIRQAQPQGPYLLTGHCAGGVVAAEVARELRRHGQEARVILFESPLLGFPALIHDWRIWAKAVRRQWVRLWTSEHPGLIGNLQRFRYRILWSAMASSRWFLAPVQNIPMVRRAIHWTEDHAGVGPLYWSMCRPLRAPCIHFLAAYEPRFLDQASSTARFGWRSYARQGIEEHYLPCDHFNILHESQLPQIVSILLRWCGAYSSHKQISSQKD
jgi:acyl-CoA synthetase (AMP-forming)/AMP-acid ligase II/thioesterase domain-containing protein